MVRPRRSPRSSATSSARSLGTMIRRVAVHFCPAFCVISVCTERMKASYVSSSASGPSTVAFRLSASTFTGTPAFNTDPWLRIVNPVSALPVKAIASPHCTCSSRSPALPHTRLSTPSGRIPASTTMRTTASVSHAVAVAGFDTTGIPANSAHAAFSARPHAGKLNALMWIATPGRGTRTCCPPTRPPRPNGIASPSSSSRRSPSSRPSPA